MDRQLIDAKLATYKLSNNLYKYHSINDNLFKILNNQELYFGSPFKFNDPFECKTPEFTTNMDDLKAYRNRLLKSREPYIVEFARNLPMNLGSAAQILKMNFEKIKSTGISCFTTDNKNALMWTHYANCHEGVCLEFDIYEDHELFSHFLPVKYSKIRREYNYIKNPSGIYKFLSTKSYIWKYENEIRVFKETVGTYPFQKSTLKSITFGCEVSKTNREEIIETLILNKISCKLFQAEPSPKNYTIEIKPYN